jgi:hypothetical protein
MGARQEWHRPPGFAFHSGGIRSWDTGWAEFGKIPGRMAEEDSSRAPLLARRRRESSWGVRTQLQRTPSHSMGHLPTAQVSNTFLTKSPDKSEDSRLTEHALRCQLEDVKMQGAIKSLQEINDLGRPVCRTAGRDRWSFQPSFAQ